MPIQGSTTARRRDAVDRFHHAIDAFLSNGNVGAQKREEINKAAREVLQNDRMNSLSIEQMTRLLNLLYDRFEGHSSS